MVSQIHGDPIEDSKSTGTDRRWRLCLGGLADNCLMEKGGTGIVTGISRRRTFSVGCRGPMVLALDRERLSSASPDNAASRHSAAPSVVLRR